MQMKSAITMVVAAAVADVSAGAAEAVVIKANKTFLFL